MKVHIGPYVKWIGPHQIAEKLLFWKDKNDHAVFNFGRWLAEDKDGNDSWLMRICEKIEQSRERKIEVRIDPYDTWNMDSTLAYIVVPMLKQLKNEKQGAPAVENSDVPKALRVNPNKKTYSKKDDELYFKRWEWVLDEMIFAFETKNTDWSSEFFTEDLLKDYEGYKKTQERISNGFRLFGKYYDALWD